LALSVLAAASVPRAQSTGIPEGFTPIFNGSNLDGWHVSRTNHHGTTPLITVEDGVIVMQQRPFGQGGLLLTDRTYTDFELYVEANPDAGFNSGIFLRSSEGGSAYQIEIVAPGGNTGALIGERMRVSQPQDLGPRVDVATVWRPDEWNSFRIRMVGEAPRVTTWINGTMLYDVQMPQNDQVAGVYGGMIGFQLHWTATYSAASGSGTGTRPWRVQRFRNVGIRELN
jgi:hypothetical protein